MAQRGGSRQGAGRPQGSINRRSKALLEEAEKNGLTPVQYLLSVMQDTTAEQNARIHCAAAVAPYLHPKLSAVEISTEDKEPLSAEQMRAKIRALLEERPELLQMITAKDSVESRNTG